ncbi:hypothetical protein M2325_000688 [Methanococcus voltae PS]|uniref:Uncharacterized protein n=1 Tax=Methanococcus voltae PS TaxID=523842 RepID=A0ABT2EYG0_METVO|nr:hypothetical protein [Methanococcus voltae]MCS3922003.1 hypothetical protein [Methanococcus voltae PS]
MNPYVVLKIIKKVASYYEEVTVHDNGDELIICKKNKGGEEFGNSGRNIAVNYR